MHPELKSLAEQVFISAGGDCLIKGNKTPDGGDGEYRALYLTRKAYEQARNPDLALIVHHKRAARFMEKRVIRDLWSAWLANTGVVPKETLSATPTPEVSDA